MKPLLAFLLLAVSYQALAQGQLTGYVTEQNSGKKPVDNVQVKSFGANTTTSASDGKFMLNYQSLTAGSSIVVRAEKEGWELVNEKEMSTLIPANPNAKPLKIVVCKAGTLEIARKKYFGITDEYITKSYNQKLAAINRVKEGWQKEAATLHEQLLSLQKQLNEIADEYSRVNLDDATDIERQAVKLFETGKIDESIKLRESLKSDIEIKKAVNEIARQDSIIALHTRNLKALAKDYTLKFDYKNAELTYEKLALADTTNFDNTFDFAYFLQQQNQHDKAIQYYQRALKLAKTEPKVAMTQNNLGILYKAKNEYTTSLSAYTKALEIYERLSKTNPATYESKVAMTQNNLGILYQDKKEYAAALSAYTKALEIYERLSKTNPATYESKVAMTQNNLGSLYQDKNEYAAALSAYTKALEIYERLSKTNPATYEPDVAMTQNNLGSLYQDKNEYAAALSAYTKALEIYERFAKTNPATYEPDVAMTQNNLGNLYKAKNEYAAALSAYTKALEIYERLSKTNPATYEPDVAMTQNNLGSLYQDQHEYAAALSAYTKALEIREGLAKANPSTYEPDVAMTQNNLGNLYKAKHEYAAALSAYTKALEIYERFAKTNPAGYEIEFCRSIILLWLLQKVDYQSDKQSQMDAYLSKAKQVLPKYESVPLAKTLLESLNDLEGFLKNVKIFESIQTLQNQLQKAEKYAEKIKIQENVIVTYRQSIVNGYPKFAIELGSSLSSLAWFQLFEKQFKAAEQSAKEALNPITFKKTENYDTEIEWTNTNLALAYLFQGNYAEAEKIYLTLKDKPYNKATYRETFLADLDELEKAGITHPDVAKIRVLLMK